MGQYLVRRILLMIPTFIGVTFLVFFITRIVPGGPIEKMISEAQMMKQGRMSYADASPLDPKQLEQLKKFYGLDQPIIPAYITWFKKLLMLDLGNSTRYSDPVWDIILERLPISFYFGLVTLLITHLVCIPLGVLKAIKHNTRTDNISSLFVFIGYAVPSYVIGIFLLVTFAADLDWFPLGEFTSDDFESFTFFGKVGDILSHTFLPMVTYMAGSFAVLTFMMKNSLMDNLSADYVRTALAKGLSFPKAVIQHAFRNSLIPLATHLGQSISLFLMGSFLVEQIYNIDGMGLLGYESVVERDYPVVMGVLVVSSVLFLVGNILGDIFVAIVDPRVRFK
ncbi:MAG: ABC transporter permease [Bdellovibrionales bacterium]|nr:ABC transporter permease [Bdellovibrionales bacterium]